MDKQQMLSSSKMIPAGHACLPLVVTPEAALTYVPWLQKTTQQKAVGHNGALAPQDCPSTGWSVTLEQVISSESTSSSPQGDAIPT